jgi:hypothetical protein
MNPNLIGLTAALNAFVVFGFTYVYWRKRDLKARLLMLLATLLLALPAFSFTLYYFHILPETAWFYELRSWRGSEFLILFVGNFMAVLASLFRRWMLPLWLVLLGGIVIAPFAKPLLAPLPESSIKDQWNGRVCIQSTGSTCGPASVTTILKLLRCEGNSERQAALACYSYLGGTEAWYLARYVRSLGMQARFEFHEGFVPGIQLPAVAGVRIGLVGHFIALLGQEGNDYIIADPLMREKRLPLCDLKKYYDFTGFYMVISKK